MIASTSGLASQRTLPGDNASISAAVSAYSKLVQLESSASTTPRTSTPRLSAATSERIT
jgi:hypothetical protein